MAPPSFSSREAYPPRRFQLSDCLVFGFWVTIGAERGRYVEEEVFGSGDDRGAETDGSGTHGGRCGPRTGRVEAHRLRLESQVRRDERERGAAAAATGRREPAAEEAGRRPQPGQGHAESGDRKKRVELVDRREEARWLWGKFLVSQRRVCGLMWLVESSYRYVSQRNDEPLRRRLLEAAREKPRWGYRRLQIVLDQMGEHVNHKRIYRVYREAGLMIRRKARKHLLRAGSPRPALDGPNQEWALDFVHDSAESGRKFRALSVVDPYTRECLALEVDTSMGSRRVTRVLEGIITERG